MIPLAVALLLAPLVIALILGMLIDRRRPAWSARRLAILAALPFPTLAALWFACIWISVALSSEVQKCGTPVVMARAGLVLAALWFAVGAGVTSLMIRHRRSR